MRVRAGSGLGAPPIALIVAPLVAIPILVGLRALAAMWQARVAVSGGSMAPTLRRGDWLLVDPRAFQWREARVGELAVLRDPRDAARVLVKRVAAVHPDGSVDVRGDAPDDSTDSRTFGRVSVALMLGRPVLRYWPPDRFGRVR